MHMRMHTITGDKVDEGEPEDDIQNILDAFEEAGASFLVLAEIRKQLESGEMKGLTYTIE